MIDFKNIEFDKSFGAYIAICTSEVGEWSDNDKPSVYEVTSAEDFMNLGIEVTTSGKAFKDLKIGEDDRDIDFGDDYEGIYIMRVA